MEQKKLGILETKEALEGVLELAKALGDTMEDGFQVTDVAVIISKISSDAVLQAALVKAVDGISKVPAEAQDLDFEESCELIGTLVGKLPGVVSSFK